MPNTPTAAYLVTNQSGKVLGRAMRLQQAEYIADEQLFGQRSTHVVDLYTTDIATLARIAEVDCPRLTVQGAGLLGAGTHPAQPYLEAMLHMPGVTRKNIRTVSFGYDTADHVVRYFLENVSTWRGDTARDVKAALRSMIA